jgi:hypothetical protein
MAGDAAAQAAFAKAYAPQSYTYAPPVVKPNMPVNNAFGLPRQSMGNGDGRMNAFGLPNQLNNSQASGQGNLYSSRALFRDLNLDGSVRNDLYSTLQNQFAAAGVPKFQEKIHNKGGPGTSVLGTPPTTTPYNYTPIQYVDYGLTGVPKQLANYATQQKNQFFVPFAPTTPTTPTRPITPTGPRAPTGVVTPNNPMTPTPTPGVPTTNTPFNAMARGGIATIRRR